MKQPLNPRSLRFQLLSRSFILLAVILFLIGLFQYFFMSEFLYVNKAKSMQAEIMSVPPDTWQRLDPRLRSKLISASTPRSLLYIPNSSIVFMDLKGSYKVLSNLNDEGQPPVLEDKDYLDALNGKKQLNYRVIENHHIQQLLVLQPVEHRGQFVGLVQVSTVTKPLREELWRQLFTFLLLSGVALILGLLVFLPVIKRTLIPLANLVDTVEHINAGNLAERFPSSQGQLEMDRLAASFNSMLERLEQSFESEKEAKEQMRQFVADASHELRTPMTSIHGFLEILLRGAVNQPEQLDKALRSMYGESDRMVKLIHDLLLLAKLDRTPDMMFMEGDLTSVVREMEPQLRLLAVTRKVDFMMESGMKCTFDSDKMKQVILNLYSNAIQHTDLETGQIEISLKVNSSWILLEVKDNGTGIDKQHVLHIFDRFYRSDTSRARKYGGSGLGLSISKAIVEAHGGVIEAKSTEGEGSTFLVKLPAI